MIEGRRRSTFLDLPSCNPPVPLLRVPRIGGTCGAEAEKLVVLSFPRELDRIGDPKNNNGRKIPDQFFGKVVWACEKSTSDGTCLKENLFAL